jgi:hypothetical protein
MPNDGTERERGKPAGISVGSRCSRSALSALRITATSITSLKSAPQTGQVAERGDDHRADRQPEAEDDALPRDCERALAHPHGQRDSARVVDDHDDVCRLRGDGRSPARHRDPTSASASAGASLMPSPTITTTPSVRSRASLTVSSLSAGSCSA